MNRRRTYQSPMSRTSISYRLQGHDVTSKIYKYRVKTLLDKYMSNEQKQKAFLTPQSLQKRGESHIRLPLAV